MRIGLIGYGGMGKHHARQIAANPALSLVAVADASEGARQRATEAHGAATFSSGEGLLAGADVEGVVIAAPTVLHGPLIQAAAAAGKHVFSEKPLCLRVEEAPAIREAIERAGITFGFGLVLRYMPPYARAHALIRSGALGRVMQAHARYGGVLKGYSYVFNPDVGGGLLNEHTIHMIDMLDYLLGPAEAISASLGRVEGRATEDHASILMHFPGGVGATLAASGITRFGGGIEITGTEKEIAVIANSRLEEITPEGRREEVPLAASADPYYLEVEEWRAAITEGRTPRTGLREALRITALLDAVRRASATGQSVSVPSADLP
jgi:myo-inositol 2-dehydrogenase / D-chiro-inositol 1-dehydrogenase